MEVWPWKIISFLFLTMFYIKKSQCIIKLEDFILAKIDLKNKIIKQGLSRSQNLKCLTKLDWHLKVKYIFFLSNLNGTKYVWDSNHNYDLNTGHISGYQPTRYLNNNSPFEHHTQKVILFRGMVDTKSTPSYFSGMGLLGSKM